MFLKHFVFIVLFYCLCYKRTKLTQCWTDESSLLHPGRFEEIMVCVLELQPAKGLQEWMTCVGPSSLCCGALLSWSATNRRAQQRLHRCNFGELDKLPFYEGNQPQTGFPSWLWFNARACVCVCEVRLCLTVGLLYLSFSLSLGRWQGFWVPSMSAFEVPCWWRQGSRVSTCGSPSTSRIKMNLL